MKKSAFLLPLILLKILSTPALAATDIIPTVPNLDLPRYMGPWFVIASIPTIFEKDGYAQVETYRLNPDGSIGATFTLRKHSFDGPFKTMHPRGFVEDPSNAHWGMRLVWPIKSEYRISYINSDYTQVIVGRSKRDHVWIMARTPTLPDAVYQKLVERVGSLGYDTTKLWKVPQRDVATAGPNAIAAAR
jgi:apolipoprotein D and lipocalin family protein